MHDTYPEDQSLRYRSSTNNEDLPGFNGAGLYDSKTQKPSETEDEGIDKSLKEVYASLWNYRAFAEREFHRIDHRTAAMGVLVHPNFKDELVNGVAVSSDIAYGTTGSFYVNSQVGEDLVTNPEPNSLPEEILLHAGGTYDVISLSNLAEAGEVLLSDAQLTQLRQDLGRIHTGFASLYGATDSEQFAMEIEFKITSDNLLSIKQARPWIFTSGPSTSVTNPSGDDTLTASLENPPSGHDGSAFWIEMRFNHPVAVSFLDMRDRALRVSGGTVTNAGRVEALLDHWRIEFTPDSNADTDIVLPPNRPCTLPGAICTVDGLRLSNRLEITVDGPAGGGNNNVIASERSRCSSPKRPPRGRPSAGGGGSGRSSGGGFGGGVSSSSGGGFGGGGAPALRVEIEGAAFAAPGSEAAFTAVVTGPVETGSVSWSVTGPDGFTATGGTEHLTFVPPTGS